METFLNVIGWICAIGYVLFITVFAIASFVLASIADKVDEKDYEDYY